MTCDHRYVFLRQEVTPRFYGHGRVRDRITEDIFFCERCLDTQRRNRKREEPSSSSFGWVEVKE